jgi:prepilin-type N-terminal cleavage/methylation domain-containing protein
MKAGYKREQGFSLIELVVVIGIIMVLSAAAIIQTSGTMASYRANASMDTVSSQLRIARQLAISQRRYVQITFNTAVTPPTVTYAVTPDLQFAPNSGNEGPPVTIPISSQTNFMQEGGVPDTPMGFGTCSGGPICIGGVSGGPPNMYFSPTGQFLDPTTNTIYNGTIFLGMANQPSTARAVTIMGGTGRVRPYTFIGPLNGTPTQVWIE